MEVRRRPPHALFVLFASGCLQAPDLEWRAELLGEAASLTDQPPALRPLSRAEAVAVAARVRELRVGDDEVPAPVAWAWARLSCELRSAAVEWSLARGPFTPQEPDGPAPALAPLTSAELTDSALMSLSATRAYDAATVWVAGPLRARQTFVLPDGGSVTVPGDDVVSWPVHIGTVIDVEGSLEVLDLAAGDEPVPLDTWLSQFAPPGTSCPPVSLRDFGAIRAYWWQRMVDGVEAPPPPPHACGTVFSSAFRGDARWLRDVPHLLPADSYGLRADLARGGAQISDEEVPRVLSRFEPLGWPPVL